MRKFLAAAGFVLFAVSCGPGRQDLNKYKEGAWYPQDFKSQVALLVRERNDVVQIMASAGLLNKEKGVFFSAKHFIGKESDGTMKIFFNGKVYDGVLLRLPPTADFAFIKIEGSFNRSEFPEAYVLGGEVKKGDEAFIKGIHPHPPELQKNKKMVPVFRFYYDMPWHKDEFVLDELEAKVTNTTVEINSKNIQGFTGENVSNTYIELKTEQDHKFSFAGLSGGPIVNSNNEVIGAVANGPEGGNYLERDGVVYRPWNIENSLPVAELKKLMPYLTGIR